MPPPTRKRPWWLHSIFNVLGGLLILAVVVGVVVVLGSGGTKNSPATPGAQGAAAPTPATPLAPPRKITAREWQLIAKDPDAHKGERIIVYGQVTQLDAATGTDTMRAAVDGVPHAVEYGYVDYETNTVLSGNPSSLQNVVQSDLFQADVTVKGAISYDTQIGGSTTVPALMIESIQVTGSAK